MPAGLILESLVAVLLIVTIGYCFILNRRLAMLRDGQNELNDVVRALNDAADKARASVEQLRRNSLSIAEDLSEKTRAGRALADELGVIVESGNGLADRLAAGLTAGRAGARKLDPLEAISRFDEGLRRPASRENLAARAAEVTRPDLSRKDTPADSDLRLALKAMR